MIHDVYALLLRQHVFRDTDERRLHIWLFIIGVWNAVVLLPRVFCCFLRRLFFMFLLSPCFEPSSCACSPRITSVQTALRHALGQAVEELCPPRPKSASRAAVGAKEAPKVLLTKMPA